MDETVEIAACEDALRTAVLAGDVATLDRLLADAATFVDQNGRLVTKEEDLAAHRSGLLDVRAIDPVGQRLIRMLGNVAIVCVAVRLAGEYATQPFGGSFAYTRVWARAPTGWRIEAAHCSAVAPA